MALFDEIYNNESENVDRGIESRESVEKEECKKYEYKSKKTISEKNKALSVLQSAIAYIQDEDIDPENIKISISVGKKYKCKYKGNNVGFL